ncbi:molybdopterin molybdenumtransferase MoeA [Streptomyces sulfonofaciens]|uniref:Molybdopterin molybdenumtransferase n=1 Tax=Streptomyces sulfonofaciens TaxID=68272 RepID=A0A919FR99_9ACTN|nr:molybdopterin molybdotransferase MoeA [Streptomyces sulfonofaciens]GHH70469.1 molybdopterin molybdenumtransferase MoeA [Streptomyces sulfonofaciens]
MTGRPTHQGPQGRPAAPGPAADRAQGAAPGHTTGPGHPGTAGRATAPGRPADPGGRQAAPQGLHPADHSHPHHHASTPWPEARAIAARAGAAQRAAQGRQGRTARGRESPDTPWTPLDEALGLVTAAPLIALTDLPSFDSSAMDGWAVVGPGPWLIQGEGEGEGGGERSGAPASDRIPRGLLAGHDSPELIGDGQAVHIATGARIPHDATAVIRSEHAHTDHRGRLYATREVVHGQDIRPRGQECRKGDRLLPSGVVITPAVLGLAAAAGYDELPTVPRPRAEVLILGDELLTAGLPHDGLIRDALGPMLAPWLRALGVEVTAVRRLGDDARALHRAVTGSTADMLVTTGGTAAGPVDHVHPTLHRIGADLLVDGVAVRPGHPMLLARTKEHQHLVGLPGNPLAAVSGLLTLAEPLARALRGLGVPGLAVPAVPQSSSSSSSSVPGTRGRTAVVGDGVQGHPRDTRLVPVALSGGDALPLHYNGPAMLRGVAEADALAVVPPGGAQAGEVLDILDLPWARGGGGSGAS